jgi:hypothetical protein
LARTGAQLARSERRSTNGGAGASVSFTVRQVVWDEEDAESEVRLLNELNDDKGGCLYFWQYTRADTRASQ